MDVIRQIAKVPTDMQDKPRIPIHIFDCGQDSKSSRPIEVEEVNLAKVSASTQQKVNDLFAEYETRMA